MSVFKTMTTLAAKGIQVVTVQHPDLSFETRVYGGRIDGDFFVCTSDPEAQHIRVCLLARMSAWPSKKTRTIRTVPAAVGYAGTLLVG